MVLVAARPGWQLWLAASSPSIEGKKWVFICAQLSRGRKEQSWTIIGSAPKILPASLLYTHFLVTSTFLLYEAASPDWSTVWDISPILLYQKRPMDAGLIPSHHATWQTQVNSGNNPQAQYLARPYRFLNQTSSFRSERIWHLRMST